MTDSEIEWSDWSDDDMESVLTEMDDVERNEQKSTVFEEMDKWGPYIDLEIIKYNRRYPKSLPNSLMEWQQQWSSSDSEYLAEKARRYKTSDVPHSGCVSPDDESDNVSSIVEDVNVELSSEDSFKPIKTMINTSDSNSNFGMNSISDFTESSSEMALSNKKQMNSKGGRKTSTTRRKIRLSRKERDNKNRSHDDTTLPSESGQERKNAKEAMDKSLKLQKMRQLVHDLHQKRLSILLKSNGLVQVPVASDGNCFMEAVCAQLPGNYNSDQLRMEICNHLSLNQSIYIDFFTSSERTTEENNTYYKEQVDFLRTAGHWVSNVANALPLVVSNLFNCCIDIYTSTPDQPVIRVQPSLEEGNGRDPILLCYNSAPGYEHYDICRIQVTDVEEFQTNETPASQESNKGNSVEEKLTSQMEADIENTGNTTPTKQNPMSELLSKLTPRKQAKFFTPPKKKYTRKKQKHAEKWKRNVRKTSRQLGKEYVSTTGKVVKEREMKAIDCSKCRFKCSVNVSDEERKAVFEAYWNLGSDERQRDFVCSHVLEKESGNRLGKDEKRKNFSREFTLRIRGRTHRVCKSFFTATLGISDKFVDYTLKTVRNQVVPFTPKDLRGKKSPANKTPKQVVRDIKNHIESFPKTASHYTRKDTKRQYLSTDLSVNKMYDLYAEQCNEMGSQKASLTMYRRVFCNEYNLSFHVPKKDQCQLCNKYYQMKSTGDLKEETELEFMLHQERKIISRMEKKQDKERAQKDNSFHVATFDLEAVLSTPCSLVSQVYYKRKLSCYNLTVYSLGTNDANCYLWNETEGKRGSCEIGTCLHLYLNSLPSHVNHVAFYSDSCIGQNRNQFVATTLQNAVVASPNLQIVEHKFLEKGHTQMECDSVHSAVEGAKKKTPVYIPSEWDTVVRMARRKDSYVVVPLHHWDFIDFKVLAKSRMQNVKYATDREVVDWLQIRWIRFTKDEPDNMLFKYDFSQNFRTLKCRVAKRGRPEIAPNRNLPMRYSERLHVSAAKKKDLLDLCNSLTIPKQYHDFYLNLPSSKAVKDKLPEPDAEEEYVDSDKE